MADQVEEVKQKTDIVSLISEHVDLKKAGRNYKALCPFHSEKTPSFMVSPELQMFKCFGCGESGDVYTFLQKHEGMDFPEALKFLADKAGVKLKPLKSGQASEKQKLYEINKLANHFYHYLLLNHTAGRLALNYLKKMRGLKVDTIKKFQLGYSPDTPLALKKYLIDKKKIRSDDLVRVGIIYKSGHGVFDRFRGRVIFPLHDHRGNVAGFAGRLMPGSKRELAKYINTPETLLYHKSSLLYGLNVTRAVIKKAKHAVVVEGELDMISSWQVGVKNVVAIKGSALTGEQARLLQRFTDRVTLALDADVAGDMAARRGITIAEGQGLEVSIATLGDFKDPDDAARRDPKKYKKILNNPVGVWDFIVDSVISRFNAKTGTGKAKISKEVIPVLSSIGDDIVRAHYAQIVAKKLGVSVEVVLNQISKIETKKGGARLKIDKIIEPKVKPRRTLLEERLMSLAFQNEPKILLKKETKTLLKTSLVTKILREYKSYAKNIKKMSLSDFSKKLPKELFQGFSDMVLVDTDRLLKGKVVNDFNKELDAVFKELRILDTKEKLKQTSEKIYEYEKNKQKRKLKQMEIEFSLLAGELSKFEAED